MITAGDSDNKNVEFFKKKEKLTGVRRDSNKLIFVTSMISLIK
jgi:hypothetical protein